MRIVDLHCYPGTKEWIACQGPYVEALAKYWKRDWSPKPETDVIAEFESAGVDVCLVALDLSATLGVDYLIIGASQRTAMAKLLGGSVVTNVAQQLPESIRLVIYG